MDTMKQFSVRILNCLRIGHRPTIGGSGITSGTVVAALSAYAKTCSEDQEKRKEIQNLANGIDGVTYPNLVRKEWIYVAAALNFYEDFLAKLEKKEEKKAELERREILAEIGIDSESQTMFLKPE